MCGIVGIVSKEPVPVSHMTSLLGSIKRRGPDSDGFWFSENNLIALGHTRLSLVDLSSLGSQPMKSSCGRWILVLNGEIYNYKKLKKRLAERFEINTWRSSSDTEVLVEAVSLLGLDATLEIVDGMFAFAAFDTKNLTITLVRDRFGEKPLYFGSQSGRFLFSSNLTCFEIDPGFDNRVSQSSLSMLLQYGYIPAPFSAYENVKKLPAAHVATFDIKSGRIEVRRYWNQTDLYHSELTSIADDFEAYENYTSAIREAVEQCCDADVDVGSFLSGGVDSTAVASVASSLSRMSPLKTFTIGFNASKKNEASVAQKNARILQSTHNQHFLTDLEALEIFTKLNDIYSEPLADSSQIPMVSLARFVHRSGVKSCISGDGGDELFGGYNRYYLMKRILSFLKKQPKVVRNLSKKIDLSSYQNVGSNYNNSLFIKNLLNYFYYNNTDHLSEIYNGVSTIEKSQWFSDLNGSNNIFYEFFDGQRSASVSACIGDMNFYLPDNVLAKVDHGSMFSGVEVRNPLLTKAFTNSLNKRVFDNSFSHKKILKKITRDHVGEVGYMTKKVGFSGPISVWIKGKMRVYCDELMLSDDREFSHLGKEQTKKIWRDYLDGKIQNNNLIWAVLVLQKWLNRDL